MQLLLIDRLTWVRTPGQVDHILTMLSNQSITYVTIGEDGETVGSYDAVLELTIEGGWVWKPVHEGQVIEAGSHSRANKVQD